MPIRLNLLAEVQAEEELRRRDPVKRAIWAGGCVVGIVLLYSGVLLTQTLLKKAEFKTIEARLESNKTQYQTITNNEKKLSDTQAKLALLKQFAGNRFLWGNVLNALQTSTIEYVQLTQFRAEQTYLVSDEVKAKHDDATGRTTIGKPAFVTQKIALSFSAKDTCATPGDQIAKYKNALAAAPFLGAANTNTAVTIKLKNLSAPSLDAETGRLAMFFSFECLFPDKYIK